MKEAHSNHEGPYDRHHRAVIPQNQQARAFHVESAARLSARTSWPSFPCSSSAWVSTATRLFQGGGFSGVSGVEGFRVVTATRFEGLGFGLARSRLGVQGFMQEGASRK